jgi:hypothetical protein
MKKLFLFILLSIPSYTFCQNKKTAAANSVDSAKTGTPDSNVKSGKANAPDALSNSQKLDSPAKAPSLYITFLNAANFDFSGKLSASYMGIFKLFAPNIHMSHWGFIAGIEKINYSSGNINGNDSTQTEYFIQNYLLNPIDHVTINPVTGFTTNYIEPGARYLQQYNQYAYKTTNTVWSFYAEPMYRLSYLGGKDNRQGLYLHLHAELLENEWTKMVNIKNLYQNPDTLIVSSNTQSQNGFYWVANNPITSNYNFLTGYFGGGATVYIDPINNDTNTHVFAQATTGFTVNSPNFDALNNPQIAPAPNGTYPLNDVIYVHAKGFYLIRLSFIQSLSKSSQLVIGGIFRGIFAANYPEYAVFLGLNLDVSAILKLITP